MQSCSSMLSSTLESKSDVIPVPFRYICMMSNADGLPIASKSHLVRAHLKMLSTMTRASTERTSNSPPIRQPLWLLQIFSSVLVPTFSVPRKLSLGPCAPGLTQIWFSGDTTKLESAVSASSSSANLAVGYGPFAISGSHSSSKSKSRTKMESTATGCR